MKTLKVERVVPWPAVALAKAAQCVEYCDVAASYLRFRRVDRHRLEDKTIHLSRRLFWCFTVRNPEFVQRDLLIEIRHERVLAVHPRELHR